jgi:UDP-3-O-[3-hydroxymyristoyl] N-acetylglucosamine deacetylase/3-hydroxyacyl-[acyl-carrier-protein] dehydratase
MLTASRPQQTIAREAEVRGVSFLAGLDVRLRFRPSKPGEGVVFVRTDLPGAPAVPALVEYVVPRQRRTALQRGEAVVEMVEHVMAALAGMRVDNCVVELDGPETPGCDGSSQTFADALEAAGVVEQSASRDVLVIDRPVAVRDGNATLTAYPGTPGRLILTYGLDYGDHTPIGRQSIFVDVTPGSFREEVAAARTFLLASEVEGLRKAGIGLRTTERDLLIFGPEGPINNTLRFPDECARHKLLDMLGDLALAGVDLAGHVVAHRSGHSLNAEMARKLVKLGKKAAIGTTRPDPSAMEIGAILEALPHRYPFLLVDRVLVLEPGRRVVALKNVSSNEPFFQGHWPGRPIMPGVLVIEAMAQAAGILIAKGPAGPRDAFLASIDRAKLRKPVVPGDQLRLEIDDVRSKGRAVQVQALARVDDAVAAEARIRFVVAGADRAA